MFDNIVKTLDEWTEPLRDFIITNHGNPFLWIALFLGGLAVFAFTYNALHKE